MTTDQIAALANAGGKASPGMNLQLMLRGEVIPAFMMDVGYTSWRRQVYDGTALSADWIFQLPFHMSEVRAAYLAGDDGKFGDPLKYVGDREEKLKAFQTTTVGIPEEYYLSTGLGQTLLGGVPGYVIVFNCPLSADRSVRVVGYQGSITGDDYTNQVELDNYIPRHVQPALICGLRRYIYREVYGTGDRRYLLEDQEYQRWIARLSESREATPSTRAVYVK